MKNFYIIIILVLINRNILFAYNYDKEYLKAIELSNNKEYQNADKIFKSLIDKSIKNKDYYKTLDFYTAEGYNLDLKGDFFLSLDSYSQAIYLIKKHSLQDYKNKSYLYNNFAHLNCKLEDYLTAINYYQIGLNSIDNDKDIDLFLDYKISIAATYLEMGNIQKAEAELNNFYHFVIKSDNLTNRLSVYANLLELYIQTNNIKEANKIYKRLITKYRKDYIKDYPFELGHLELKLNILNNTNLVDSIYESNSKNIFNELNLNLINLTYGEYLVNSGSVNKGILFLEKSLKYFETIKNYEKVLNISKLIINNTNKDSYKTKNKIIFLQDQILNTQKKNLFKTIEKNNLLVTKIYNIEKELEISKLLNYIYLSIIIIISISIIFVLFYDKLNVMYNLSIDKNLDLNLMINKIKLELSNNLLESQEIYYTKSEINKEDLKKQNNNLLTLINYIHGNNNISNKL